MHLHFVRSTFHLLALVLVRLTPMYMAMPAAYCSVSFHTLPLSYVFLLPLYVLHEARNTRYNKICSSHILQKKGMVLKSPRKMEARREAPHATTLGGSCKWRRRKWKHEQQQRKRNCRQQWERQCRQYQLSQPSRANHTKDTFKLGIQLDVRVNSATDCNYG